MNILFLKLRRFCFKLLKQNQVIYLYNYRKYLSVELSKAEEDFNKLPKEIQRSNSDLIDQLDKYWNLRTKEHFLYYRLFEKQSNLEEFKKYVPPFKFVNDHQERLQKNINFLKYTDKLEQYYLFNKVAINTPSILCFSDRGTLYDIQKNSISIDTAYQILCSLDVIVAKPLRGSGGYGIVLLTNKKQCKDFLETIVSKRESYLFQEKINQVDELQLINPSSINTLRVVMCYEHLDSCPLKVCILRMGRLGSFVDNSAQGGISVGINVDSGEFYPIAYGEHIEGGFEVHPDSKFVFQNSKINNWNTLKKSIIDCGDKLESFKDFAFDVVITNEGIVILEMNFHYGIDHIQRTIGGVRDIFNIKPN